MSNRRHLEIRARAAREVHRLTPAGREVLAIESLTFAHIRRATMEDGHWQQALQLLGELAPTLAAHLHHTTLTADRLTPEDTQ